MIRLRSPHYTPSLYTTCAHPRNLRLHSSPLFSYVSALSCATETHLTSSLSIGCAQLSSPRRGGACSPVPTFKPSNVQPSNVLLSPLECALTEKSGGRGTASNFRFSNFDFRPSAFAGVAATKGIPANHKHVEEHLQAVAEHVDFSSGGMAPAHGNFHRAQAVVACQIKQFRVEPEALDGLLLEQDLAALPDKGFEAALRVHKRQPQDEAHDFVENDSCEFAEARFVHRDEAAIDGARADGHVEMLERVHKLVRFLDGSGEVCVGEQNHTPTRFLHAVAHAVPFSSVYTVGHNAQRGNFVAEGFGDGGGAVLRTVVHDEHFHVAAAVFQVSRDALQSSGQAQPFVERGNDDGEFRRSRAHRSGGFCQA